MAYSFTIVALPYLLATLITGFVSVYSFIFYERTRASVLFSLTNVSMTIWMWGSLFSILATDLQTMILWEYFLYFGVNFSTVFFLLFALTFASFSPKLFSKPLYLTPLFIPGIIDYLLLITNDLHGLYFQNFSSTFTPLGFEGIIVSYGPLYVVHLFITATFIVGGYIMLLQAYRRSPHQIYRRQFQLFLFGVSVFLIFIVISTLRLFEFNYYLDISPLGYLFTCFFILVGMREYHLIDLTPLAQKVIISNLTNTGVFATDKRNRIIEMNPIALEYLITDEKTEVIGKHLFSTISSQHHLHDFVKDRFMKIEDTLEDLINDPSLSKSCELELIHPETLEREFFNLSTEAIQTGNRLTGFMYLLRNITPEKQVEEATRKTVDFKDSLLGVISHDLKNQFFVIHGFTELIRKELLIRKGGSGSDLLVFLEGIDAKVNEATSVIQQVRNYLKSMGTFDEQVPLSVIDLKPILDSVLSSLKPQIDEKQLDLKISLPKEHKKIQTLADLRVRSVFINILDNSIKWSPDKGDITILVEVKDDFWYFSFSDQGEGVPDSMKKLIFKPFIAFGPEEKSGSGLGLSIADEILQSFQGRIWVEDNSPHGAKFVFNLPVVPSRQGEFISADMRQLKLQPPK